MSVTDHDIVVDGLRLHYVASGRHRSGPIVLLHRGGLSARTWNDVCQGLQSRYCCYALDLRGPKTPEGANVQVSVVSEGGLEPPRPCGH